MKGKTREENRQLWLSRISDLAESGLSQREWCNEKGISASTLRYWIEMLRDPQDTETPPSWLKVNLSGNSQVPELKAPDEPNNSKDHISVRYEGYTVKFPDGCSSKSLFEVLKVLKAL